MYKKAIYTLRSNERLTPAVWRMTLEGDTQWITAPGQFVNVELDGCYLRRPISVCDWDERTITLIYKVVGEGTALMAGLRPGARLDLLTGLGNGFDVTKGSLYIANAKKGDTVYDVSTAIKSGTENKGNDFGKIYGDSRRTIAKKDANGNYTFKSNIDEIPRFLTF